MRELGPRSFKTMRVCALLFGSFATFAWADVGYCQNASSGVIDSDAVSNTAVRNRQAVAAGLVSTGASQVLAVPAQIIPQRQVSVFATAGIGYDSNATRTNSERPLPAGESKDDIIAPLRIAGTIVIPNGPNLFTLDGLVGYEFYAKNSYLNSEDIRLNGSYRRNINACDIGANGSFYRDRTDYSNTDLFDLGKNLETTEVVGGTFSCTLESGIRPFASVNYTHGRNSLAIRALNDYNNIVYGGGVTLGNVLGSTIGIVGNLSQNVYVNRPVGGLFGARNVHVKSIGGYFRRASARIIQAEIQLNYTIVDKTVGVPSFHGLSGTASVHVVPGGGRLTFDLIAYRTIGTSLSYNSSYNIETDFSLQISQVISSKFRLAAVLARLDRKKRGIFGVETDNLTSDNTKEATLIGAYTFSPALSFNLSTTYQDRGSNDSGFNYSGVRAIATVGLRL